MKHARTLILAGALPALIGLPNVGQADDWVDIKDPQELRALYSNKTFRGAGWVGYYRADGTGTLIRQGSKPVRRTWAVKGNDQVCTTSEGGTTLCYTFRYISKDRTRLMLTIAPDGPSYIFTVEEGLPKF